ncbi:uncharacterized protein MYCFIDRAFT_170342 [Pseudocercospora fijiensis CIRAD86]|uniref:Uncharacterized protein n=1 Tax=Pseudocercospora fijiensis (strain CIRAD86) TaxID=383855 RepID=N1QBV8_PSEFD|nr:uncharacterized protein MYCFIDRAFT_170342 [Pseudocercospora fijiensis CIRAD86]EME88762.1 hypothetical protein MYCFIDRAFT_170342 [Pseudocercospora fijiensis CIRAD86]
MIILACPAVDSGWDCLSYDFGRMSKLRSAHSVARSVARVLQWNDINVRSFWSSRATEVIEDQQVSEHPEREPPNATYHATRRDATSKAKEHKEEK